MCQAWQYTNPSLFLTFTDCSVILCHSLSFNGDFGLWSLALLSTRTQDVILEAFSIPIYPGPWLSVSWPLVSRWSVPPPHLSHPSHAHAVCSVVTPWTNLVMIAQPPHLRQPRPCTPIGERAFSVTAVPSVLWAPRVFKFTNPTTFTIRHPSGFEPRVHHYCADTFNYLILLSAVVSPGRALTLGKLFV